MKTLVISLGGSLIIPEKFETTFLRKFKTLLRKHYKTHKFVIVTGGGSIARKYIAALRAEGKTNKELAQAGIRATRLNAQFLMQLFGKEANDSLPKNMKDVTDNLPKNKLVICGALRFAPNETSDSTAAKLAHKLKTEFINLTDVPGLYNKNPKTNKDAKLISKISWKSFEKIANKIDFKAGQNFILDQQAATIIRKHKIPTYIIGDLKQLNNLLNNKPFTGTTIHG